jgi:hypothetical protein
VEAGFEGDSAWGLWHGWLMESVISRGKMASLPDVLNGIRGFASDQEEKLIALCNSAFDYEREHIHLGNPTAEEEREFLEALKQLQAQVKLVGKLSPFSDLGWLARRIQLSIDLLENPMSEEEADRFLAKHFPE